MSLGLLSMGPCAIPGNLMRLCAGLRAEPYGIVSGVAEVSGLEASDTVFSCFCRACGRLSEGPEH